MKTRSDYNFLAAVLICLIIAFFKIPPANAGELVIKSEPTSAEVYVGPLNDSRSTKIGLTPLSREVSEIVKAYVQGKAFILELRKDGYSSKRFIIPDIGGGDINLMVSLELSDNLKFMRQMDSLFSQIIESQNLMRAKNYEKALAILQEQETKFPQLSIIPEFQGITYYLMESPNQSLEAYKKAIAINPENYDALKMKQVLEKSLGVQGGKR